MRHNAPLDIDDAIVQHEIHGFQDSLNFLKFYKQCVA